MVTIRSINEIILNLIDFYRLAEPDLDTKPGTVARDLFIDAPASQLSLLYDELSSIADKQSLRLVVASDLDKLAKNFGVVRRQATPASGTALLTFSSINAPININRGDVILASNGFSYTVTSGLSVLPSASNFYRSVASKFRSELDIVGIDDEFAVETTVLASTAGTAGNIGKFSLNRTTIAGVSNVTNIVPFSGGTDQENDALFRDRILSSFSGSSVGTALGYLNVALGTTGVSDALVVEPGDPLMTRDGTVVKINADGSRTVVSEGSGGKVDIIVLGSTLVENTDSFIYRDRSNNNDPTSAKNNIVLGQISGDENKTINKKRVDNIKSGVVPKQPVSDVLEVSGSISGSNFIEKSIDTLGRVTGNYELLKDSGVYGGSPWGFDTFHWISNKISLFEEDLVKGQFNGQDAVTFTDVLEIPQVQQNISITNENSIVNFDRSIIKLLHTPATNVTRVFNVNTGERYIVTNQNLDNTGLFNETGRIQISGNTLPVPSDVLQVDYNWIVDYDQYSDYDGLSNTNNPRDVTDSIDWGYASAVKNEKINFVKSVDGNFFTGTSLHPVTTVVTANIFTEIDGVVQEITSGTFINRLSVTLTNLSLPVDVINSIKCKNTNTELFDTAQNNGLFINSTIVVGIEILYEVQIILPTDTVVQSGDQVSVFFNATDVFNDTSIKGSSNGTEITIPSSLITTTASSINLLVNYIGELSDLLNTAITSLPTSRIGNGFAFLNNNGFNNFSIVNTSRREHQTIQRNLSNQLYVELNLSSTQYLLDESKIISIIRLSDSKELWTPDNPGSVVIGGSGNYQLIIGNLNAPAPGEKALIVYRADDILNFQPFTYQNSLIKYRVDFLATDPSTNRFVVPLNVFSNQAETISFEIIEPNTDIILMSANDGYLIPVDNASRATLTSSSVNFATLPDLVNKKVRVFNSADFNNNGIYDIDGYNTTNHTITIGNFLDKISPDQIAIIRIQDGQEIWNYNGTINIEDNKLLLPSNTTANFNDAVITMIFNFNNLRQAPTRLACNISDQIVNTGVISVAGTTLTKAANIVFTATNTGLKLNLNEALRKALGLNSASALPTNVKLVKIAKLEKVITASSSNDEIISVLVTYDTKGSSIKNNLYYSNEFTYNGSLNNLEFILPSTQNNSSNLEVQNIPKIGDKLRITFYYITEGDLENLSYTRNGVLYTNKRFALINKVYVASGFKTSQSTRFTATSLTQPSLGARYKALYDYSAPKQNERINIRYNYNQLISDVTFNLENTRPINADVLAREAKLILLDLTMNVVISDNFKSSSATVLQNLRDKLITALTTNVLESIIDTPTLINVAQSVEGIARARILYFNKNGEAGSVSKIQAQKDEYFASNIITLNTETR